MPETFESLVIFLVFAVPAYLAIIIYRRRYPLHYHWAKQSPLAEVTLYAFLGSMVIILTVFFLWLLWSLTVLLRNALLPRVIPTLNVAADSAEGLFIIAFLLIIAYYAPGVLFSLFVGSTVPRVLREDLPPAWVGLMEPALAGEWLLVHLKNGDQFLGLISQVRWIGDQDCKMELTLEKAFRQAAGSQEREEVGRVRLRSDDILWWTTYLG
jgi:hypothetical protein